MSEASSSVHPAARPYANAVFEFAQAEEKTLANWNHALDLLASITADPQFAAFSSNPRVTSEQLQEVVFETAAKAVGVSVDKLHPPFINLIKLLARNGRLDAAPEIARIFAARRAEAESVIEAEMVTADKISEAQRKKFSTALKKKLGRTVQLEFVVDEELIGGAIVRAGDWVIDGSVRAQLEQLSGAINS